MILLNLKAYIYKLNPYKQLFCKYLQNKKGLTNIILALAFINITNQDITNKTPLLIFFIHAKNNVLKKSTLFQN